MKHGIAIREKGTDKLIDFAECSVEKALKVLSGIRHNINNERYYASEEYVDDKEIENSKNG